MKVLKGFLRFILVVIAVVLIFAIVIVCTYVLGSPNTNSGTESRNIVSGPWSELITNDREADLMVIDLNQNGEFKIVKGKDQIADGWFKIDEKAQKIKMLMLPDHYTDAFAPYVKYKVLSEMSYSNLKFQLKAAEFGKDPEIIKDKEPEITFLIRAGKEGAADTLIVNCKMYQYTLDLYASEHDLTRNA